MFYNVTTLLIKDMGRFMNMKRLLRVRKRTWFRLELSLSRDLSRVWGSLPDRTVMTRKVGTSATWIVWEDSLDFVNVSESTGFNMEDLINVTALKGGGDMQGFKVEQVMGKLRRLQQGKGVLEEEIKEIKSVSDSLQKELAILQTEAYQLEGIHKEKEELCRKLQFQCEESEQKSSRQLMQNKKSDELLEQYRCAVQEFKLKHRKQRMKFENQLHQLIEQHKNLHSVFSPERLPDEIGSAENTKRQLLSAEQIKLAQLHHLNEQLEEVKQKQPGTTAVDTQEE